MCVCFFLQWARTIGTRRFQMAFHFNKRKINNQIDLISLELTIFFRCDAESKSLSNWSNIVGVQTGSSDIFSIGATALAPIDDDDDIRAILICCTHFKISWTLASIRHACLWPFEPSIVGAFALNDLPSLFSGSKSESD